MNRWTICYCSKPFFFAFHFDVLFKVPTLILEHEIVKINKTEFQKNDLETNAFILLLKEINWKKNITFQTILLLFLDSRQDFFNDFKK